MDSSVSIVVVEDDPSTLEYLILLLETSGYHVLGARSGSALWAQVTPASVQAILLDRRLPDIDGLLLCQDLRDALGEGVPIIMMTADAEPGLLAATRAAGASRLLRKPFMSHTLLDTLASVLQT